jgi:hypothetical protein
LADQGRMVKDWFQKAARDLKTAKLLLTQNNFDFEYLEKQLREQQLTSYWEKLKENN